jgi:hypothetical protein
MTREQSQRLVKNADIVRAHADGKIIERWLAGEWHQCNEITFVPFDSDRYRIRPEPREWWANEYAGTDHLGNGWRTKEEAEALLKDCPGKIIHLREVLDDGGAS